jgi:hypothetical protein
MVSLRCIQLKGRIDDLINGEGRGRSSYGGKKLWFSMQFDCWGMYGGLTKSVNHSTNSIPQGSLR